VSASIYCGKCGDGKNKTGDNEADKNGRAFIENLQEVQLDMEKNAFICWNNKTDKSREQYKNLVLNNFYEDFVDIPGKDFKMLKIEVTQEYYRILTDENPSSFIGDDNPVENVSWYAAVVFCNRLSEKQGLTPVYSVAGNTDLGDWYYKAKNGEPVSTELVQDEKANGYRLPTVEEWLYCAKGGQDFTYAGSDDLNEAGWYGGNSENKTHPVAEKKANGYGLFDMSGNVWEWCWEAADCNYCGGSWSSKEHYCKVDYRHNSYEYESNPYVGFRLVRAK